MKKLSSFYVIILALFSLSACSGAMTPLKAGESCLNKLEGTWKGEIYNYPSNWGTQPYRTLTLSVFDSKVYGYYGITGQGAQAVDIEILKYDCGPVISFTTSAGARITLSLAGDKWLSGSFKLLDFNEKDIRLLKK